MTPSELVAALEGLAAELRVPVRQEALPHAAPRGRPQGGLCRVRGQPVIFLDATLSASEKLVILAQALTSLDLRGHELKPAVRAALRAHGHAGAPDGPLRPLARTTHGKDDDEA